MFNANQPIYTARPRPQLGYNNLLLIFKYNSLAHRVHNLTKELGRMSPREANLLSQIVRKQIQQILVALFIQQWLVDELCIRVALATLRDGEVEV